MGIAATATATTAFMSTYPLSRSGVSPSWRPQPCIRSTAAIPPMPVVAVTAPYAAHRDHHVHRHVAVAGVLAAERLGGPEDQVEERREHGDEEHADVVTKDPAQLQSSECGIHRATSCSVRASRSGAAVMVIKALSSDPLAISRLLAPSSPSSARATASESPEVTVTRWPWVVASITCGMLRSRARTCAASVCGRSAETVRPVA